MTTSRRKSPQGEFGRELAAFAADLRALRIAQGNPSYATISKNAPVGCSVSKSTVGSVMTGTHLPSFDTTAALVRAILTLDPDGGAPPSHNDPRVTLWLNRWRRLMHLQGGSAAETDPSPAEAVPAAPPAGAAAASAPGTGPATDAAPPGTHQLPAPSAPGDGSAGAPHEPATPADRARPDADADAVVPRLQALLHRAGAERDKGALGEAEELYRTVLHQAIEYGAWEQEGWAWDGLGSCHWRGGEHELALKSFVRAERVADGLTDKALKAWTLYNFGVYWSYRGRNPKAGKDFLHRALETARTSGNLAALGWTHHALAELAHERGRHQEELEHYAAAARAGHDSHDDSLTAWSLLRAAESHEHTGDLPQAHEHFTTVRELATRLRHDDLHHRATEGTNRTEQTS